MRRFVIAGWLLMLMGLVQPSFAQGNRARRQAAPPVGIISGMVVEAENGSPIAGATVAVLGAADSALVTGSISGPDGRFKVEGLRMGRYVVRISFLGFQTAWRRNVRISRAAPERALGTVRLSAGTEQLSEVEVTAGREEVTFEIDRTVYNTSELPLGAGASATELLENIPSVEVDVDGKVSLRGTQKVAILINGRPAPVRGDALTSLLEQLPAEMIERVEVIPNPSARYNPDGSAGILNLVLDDRVEFGLGGGLNASLATQGRMNAGGNLRFQRGKLSTFGQYAYRHDNRETENLNFRENRYRNPLTYLDQENTSQNITDAHVLNARAEYRPARGSSISLRSLVNYRNGSVDRLNLSAWLDSARVETSSRRRLAESRSNALNFSHEVEYRRDFQPGRHEFSARAEVTRSKDEDFDRFEDEVMPTDALERETNALDAADYRLSLDLDYQRPLGRRTRLEAGYRGMVRAIESQFYAELFVPETQAYAPQDHQNHAFTFGERVHAAYGNLGTSFGRLAVQAGLRLEQTDTRFEVTGTTDTYDHGYFSVYPSAFVAWRPGNARSQVRLSYSKRIERPRTMQLNPFARYDDPLNLRVGNPYLRPEFTHAFELALQRFSRGASYSLTPFYRRTVDIVRRYKSVGDDGVSTVTFANLSRSYSYGAEAVVTRRLGPFSLTGSASGYRLTTDGTNIDTDLGRDAFTWNAKINSNWRINDGLTAQIHWLYKAPIDVEQGHISAVSTVNLALRQKLFADRGTLSLKLSDPFDAMSYRFEAMTTRYYQESTRRRETRMLQVSFSYTFGQKPKLRQDRDDEDLSEPELEEVEID